MGEGTPVDLETHTHVLYLDVAIGRVMTSQACVEKYENPAPNLTSTSAI